MADYRLDPQGIRPGYPLEKLAQSGAADGEVPVWNDSTGQWEPGTAGGGSGVVETIVAGTGISVDSTDPANPIVAATGGGGGGTLVGCGVSRSTSQTLTNATHAAVIFNDADTWDTNSIHDPASNPSRFTIPAGHGGVWAFKTSVQFSANTNGDRQLSFTVNGSSPSNLWSQRVVPPGTAGRAAYVAATAELLLAAGDYVEIDMFCNFSSTLTVVTAVASAHFVG